MNANSYDAFALALYDFWGATIVLKLDIERTTKRGCGAMTKRSDVMARLFDAHDRLKSARLKLGATAPDSFLVDSGRDADYIRQLSMWSKTIELGLREAVTGGAKLSDVRIRVLGLRDDLECLTFRTTCLHKDARGLAKAAEKTSADSE